MVLGVIFYNYFFFFSWKFYDIFLFIHVPNRMCIRIKVALLSYYVSYETNECPHARAYFLIKIKKKNNVYSCRSHEWTCYRYNIYKLSVIGLSTYGSQAIIVTVIQHCQIIEFSALKLSKYFWVIYSILWFQKLQSYIKRMKWNML